MAYIDARTNWELERRAELLKPGSEQEVLILVEFSDCAFDATSIPGIQRYTHRDKNQDRQLVTGNFQAVEMLRNNPAIKSAKPAVGCLMRVNMNTAKDFNPESLEGVLVTSTMGDIFAVVVSTTGLDNIAGCKYIIGVSGD